MTPRTLPKEPWRQSMICGWQVAFGDWTHGPAWCAGRKANGEHFCQSHHWQALGEYGADYTVAPGNALGAPELAVRLLWEGEEPGTPVEASAEEMARYAAILDLARGE
jgi:hypothetical protein